MLKHDRFEELCASASIGQASGEELAQLREHLTWCSPCQERYSEFLTINASQYSSNVANEELSFGDAVDSIDSTLFRQRFLKKAAAQGIVFSADRFESPLPAPQVSRRRFWPVPIPRFAGAFALLAIVGGLAYYPTLHRSSVVITHTATSIPNYSRSEAQAKAQATKIAKLELANRDLAAQIAALQGSLTWQRSRISHLQSASALSEDDRLTTLAQLQQEQKLNEDLQTGLQKTQNEITNLRSQYQAAQSSADGYEADFVADEVKIRELSNQIAESSKSLTREKDMLAAGRDIRELMAARNLHIVDVFDTDPKGKTRPAFGRIFFTEGKSLLFYAYDMPDTRLKEAGYHYEIWGKKEGPNQPARSLGIFFSDDKNQKRWVFQYDDPKVLNEIDSVFVTLEPPNTKSNKPKGDKLLYAYLKGQANHP